MKDPVTSLTPEFLQGLYGGEIIDGVWNAPDHVKVCKKCGKPRHAEQDYRKLYPKNQWGVDKKRRRTTCRYCLYAQTDAWKERQKLI